VGANLISFENIRDRRGCTDIDERESLWHWVTGVGNKERLGEKCREVAVIIDKLHHGYRHISIAGSLVPSNPLPPSLPSREALAPDPEDRRGACITY